MTIGGLQKVSLSDFPGRVAAVVFAQGCNMRCLYCHNPELVDPCRFARPVLESAVLGYLRRRRGLLQGVVVTGGEPALQEDLMEFLRQIKSLGLAVKLDTNGSRPDCVRKLIEQQLVDYVALDIKAPMESYSLVVGVDFDASVVDETLRLVVKSGIDHEVRTTYSADFLSLEALRRIAHHVRDCRRFALQAFRPVRTLSPAASRYSIPSVGLLETARRIFEAAGLIVTVR